MHRVKQSLRFLRTTDLVQREPSDTLGSPEELRIKYTRGEVLQRPILSIYKRGLTLIYELGIKENLPQAPYI